MMSQQFLIIAFSIVSFLFANVNCNISYCQPSNSTCWPNSSEISTFSNKLDGSIIIKNLSNPQYINLVTKVQNPWTITYPSFIILTISHTDIQNCVSFASFHNIQISIQSTGHSYSGRNSANNSLQINLNSMQSFSFNTNINPPTITVESGLRWGQIYSLINYTLPNYVIIGAGDPSVGPTGYSSLGGHSPLTPKYGLSSDYILQFFIVIANSDILRVYDTNGFNQSIDNLFWSLKGGGASTFGIILNITFELIKIDNENDNNFYNYLSCNYPLYSSPILKKKYIGYDVLYNYFNYIQNGFDSSVTGYMQIEFSSNYGYDFYFITFAMIYYGNNSYSQQIFEPLMVLNPYNNNPNSYCKIIQYKYFWDLWSSVPPDTGGISPNYIFNDFIPKNNLTNKYADNLLLLLNETHLIENAYGFYTATGTMIGGYNNLNNFPYGINNSIGYGFRSSYFSMSCNIYWNETAIILKNESLNDVLEYSKKWEKTFMQFGNGIYSNEENYECDDCDWKNAFWGNTNYDKLLKVKQEIDPNQVFWCNHCVGSDL